VRPLEHLRFAGGRALEMLARRAAAAVGLHVGADRIEVNGEQLVARHLEQPQRRLVRLDETLRSGSMTVMASGA
jgi:hypothetical protein